MLVYFVPYSFGGSADYSLRQIIALSALGVKIELVAPKAFLSSLRSVDISDYTELIDRKPRKLPKLFRALIFMQEMVQVHRTLALHLRRSSGAYVLMGDFGEYMAPIWAPMLQRAKANGGLRFGCILHDPVRDLVRGPRAWHKASMKAAFGVLDQAFVHGQAPAEVAAEYPRVEFVEVPHGVFLPETSSPPRLSAREQLGLPVSAPVLLQFGHVRDNKNIATLIKSLALMTDVHLVIAGEESSGGQLDGASYLELAKRLGVQSRVHFRLGFVPPDEIPVLFAAADAVCLVYSKSFRSMSGVLAHAMTYEKPVVASGGNGPLKHIVQRYHLGEWIEEVDERSVASAIASLFAHNSPQADWKTCRQECRWERNAEIVASKIHGTGA